MSTKNHMCNAKQQKGFALIEILLVISIIALMTSVLLAALRTTRAKTRDARRISDMKTIAAALGAYHIDNSQYPSCPGTDGSLAAGIAGMACLKAALVPQYLRSLPQDPLYPGATYQYDNYCGIPQQYGLQYYRLWANTEMPQQSGGIWWTNMQTGQTACMSPI